MRCRLTVPYVPALWMCLATQALAGPFVVFPKARQLESPGRQFAVIEQEAEADFGGTFHALWLRNAATGESRRLYGYIGTAAVAWESDDSLIITEYLSRKTSRALLLSVSRPTDSIMIDVPMLIRSLPPESRDTVRENDHVFVEALGTEASTFHLRVWGYGRHDPQGFRWRCEYGMSDGHLRCSGEQAQK